MTKNRRHKNAGSSLLTDSVLREEIDLESGGVREGVMRYRRNALSAINRGAGSSLKPAERLTSSWFKPMVTAVRELKRDVRKDIEREGGWKGTGAAIGKWGPLLMAIDAERAAVVVINEALSQLMSSNGMGFTKLAYTIGRNIYAEINYDLIRQQNETLLPELRRHIGLLNCRNINWWAKKHIKASAEQWSRMSATKVGASLLWMLVGVASASGYDEEFTLAFEVSNVRVTRKKITRIIAMSEAAQEVIRDGHDIRQYMRPRRYPMLIKPITWKWDSATKTISRGGYIRVSTPLVSHAIPQQRRQLAEADDLSTALDGLNTISATAWRINPHIMDLMEYFHGKEMSVCGLPEHEDPPIPPSEGDMDEEQTKAYKRTLAVAFRHRKAVRSNRTWFNMRMEVAKKMRGRTFYFPHQFDFRGRAYPLPQHLNHYGDDVSRGLLEFATARPMNHDAIWWLKIHAANCYGIDKAPFNARVGWVDDNMALIQACCESPEWNTWWQQADTPWQFLAACYGLLDPALGAHIPVQMDGSCNGLQHFAALGRDLKGGSAVNLVPMSEPQDIYSYVTEAAIRRAQSDADEGNDVAAASIEYITRKVVKRPVMTSVYGVTMVGARKQIQEELADAGMPEAPISSFKVAHYLSGCIRESIGDVCNGATSIMTWLQDTAKHLSRDHQQRLRWHAPSGLPVMQRYEKSRSRTASSLIHTMVAVEDHRTTPRTRQQVNGSAPNFVHSLDATHMLLTAGVCRQRGIEFASVHDSYWTHASDASKLHQILRDQFVELHKADLLLDLYEQWKREYPQADIKEPPKPGELSIESVRQSIYLFS